MYCCLQWYIYSSLTYCKPYFTTEEQDFLSKTDLFVSFRYFFQSCFCILPFTFCISPGYFTYISFSAIFMQR